MGASSVINSVGWWQRRLRFCFPRRNASSLDLACMDLPNIAAMDKPELCRRFASCPRHLTRCLKPVAQKQYTSCAHHPSARPPPFTLIPLPTHSRDPPLAPASMADAVVDVCLVCPAHAAPAAAQPWSQLTLLCSWAQ